jgi:hypothetical protein
MCRGVIKEESSNIRNHVETKDYDAEYSNSPSFYQKDEANE